MDCSPVKGIYKGSSGHSLEVSVTVDDDNPLYKEEPTLIDPVPAPAANHVVKNSYQRYMEMMQQQQQQQQ